MTGEPLLTASGSVQFFVGMTESEIAVYREEYAAWEEAQRMKREAAQQEDAEVPGEAPTEVEP